MEKELLTQFLSSRDVGCPQCDFNLRGVTSESCPECGETLQLGVNLAAPKQAVQIAGLISLSAGVVNLAIAALVEFREAIWHLHIKEFDSQEWALFFAVFVGLILMAAALFAWLHKWRSIRKFTSPMRWLLVAACWGLSAITMFVVFALAVGTP